MLYKRWGISCCGGFLVFAVCSQTSSFWVFIFLFVLNTSNQLTRLLINQRRHLFILYINPTSSFLLAFTPVFLSFHMKKYFDQCLIG